MSRVFDFPSLLRAAAEQSQPQRLLFVFLKAKLPKDHDAEQAERFHAGMGGGLVPVLCCDKTPEELRSFEELANESRQFGDDWQVVVCGALSGREGRLPTRDQAEITLRQIIQTVNTGGDLSHLIAFDRDGTPLYLEAAPAH